MPRKWSCVSKILLKMETLPITFKNLLVKHMQTIRLQQRDCFSVFDHFIGLALKGLKSQFLFGRVFPKIIAQAVYASR